MNMKLTMKETAGLILGGLVILAGTVTASAAQIDPATIAILGSSSTAYPGYGQGNAIDLSSGTTPNYLSDYASFGGGASTHLDFDFGGVIVFTEITQTDRTSSGSGNNSNVRGPFDFTTSYEYSFYSDSTFTSPFASVIVSGRSVPVSGDPNLLDFQTTSNIGGIAAQFVRYQVLATQGSNPGVADLSFSGSPAPEPSTMAMLLFGSLAVFGKVRARRCK